MNTKLVSNESLEKVRLDAVRMVTTRNPGADTEWWESLLLIVVELQDRRSQKTYISGNPQGHAINSNITGEHLK